ncbi:uncharacterized protein LOC130139353 [Syzygium oleosum]|uniref:uncharacterized protein LOC130139353 n=1 Tax=Syzygium oleosum TaxID=219896 RepID=UPI0024B8DEC9|nr:uncharacterized protein LOC130139353 [Syzygium oleosum]
MNVVNIPKPKDTTNELAKRMATDGSGRLDGGGLQVKDVDITRLKRLYTSIQWMTDLMVMDCKWLPVIRGSRMFIAVAKLKALKQQLKGLNRSQFGDLHLKVKQAKENLKQLQQELVIDPFNPITRAEEKAQLEELLVLSRHEEVLLKQKSRNLWLKEGDNNSKHLLGNPSLTSIPYERYASLFHEDINTLVTFPVVQRSEILRVLKGFNDFKAPGPDGFNSLFYKSAWHIIGKDIEEAIMEFFSSKRMLKSINSTLITLVPKVQNPSFLKEFRPISCCNVIYKIISKLVAERIRCMLPKIVGFNQTAFISGRQISENILLCQDLLHNYHKGGNGKRVAIKIDLMKAFDMVKWDAVLGVLKAINTPHDWIALIAECITTPTFSVNFNGEQVGYFKSTNGLRQGDPLSPYLFVMVMEIFNRIIHAKVAASSFKCLFATLTGLRFHPDKCQIFFSGLNEDEKHLILDYTPFSTDEVLMICRCAMTIMKGKKMNIETLPVEQTDHGVNNEMELQVEAFTMNETWILGCLKGTIDVGIVYWKDGNDSVARGYVDLDYVHDLDEKVFNGVHVCADRWCNELEGILTR